MDIKSTKPVNRISGPPSNTDPIYNKASSSCVTTQAHRSSSSHCTSNKRKRRSTLDDEDIENHPHKKANLSYYSSRSQPNPTTSTTSNLSPVQSSPFSTDLTHEIGSIITESSSECQSTVVEYDLSHLSSPTSPDAMSPTSCHSDSNIYESWHSLADVKRHGKKKFTDYGVQCCIKPTSEIRFCPLPALSWANAYDVWSLMCRKDKRAALDRDSSMLNNHPGLQPRMRAILLDWLIEVCEVYKLHRETYYLAVDYLDRYLSGNRKVQKTHLQLIGITCLFIAAKVEEIYPPKIGEFAYVTDGACQEEDILQHELLLLKALDWNISPVTVMGWLGVYMQLNVTNRTPSSFLTNESRTDTCASKNEKSSVPSVNNSNNLLKSVNDNHKNSDDNKNNININNNNNSNSNNYNKNNSDYSQNLSNSCTSSKYSFKGNCSYNSNSSDTESIKITSDVNSKKISVDNDVISVTNSKENGDAFIYPQFSGMEFAQTAQLVDLCSLDLGFANFPYSVIAAAAMSHTFNREIAVRVSGLDWSIIEPCSSWMEPYFQIVCDESQHLFLLEQNEQVKSKFGLAHICPNILTDDSYIIQTHSTSMEMLDKVMLKREQCNPVATTLQHEASPAISAVCPEGLLTPPASSRKSLDGEGEDDGEEDHVNANTKNETIIK